MPNYLVLLEQLPGLIQQLMGHLQKRNDNRAAAASEEATGRALEAIRSDLAVSAEAHNTVRRQLSEQAAQVLAAADAAREAAQDARATRSALDEIEGRTLRLERRLRSQSTLLGVTLALNILLLILVAVLLIRH